VSTSMKNAAAKEQRRVCPARVSPPRMRWNRLRRATRIAPWGG